MASIAQQRTAGLQKPNSPSRKPENRQEGSSQGGESLEDGQPGASTWWSNLVETFRVAPFGNGCVFAAMVIGFFHGWLKRAQPGVISVFAYDIPLALGLVAAWMSIPRGKPLFADSRVAMAIKAVIGVVVVYSLIPTDVPWLIRLASVRGWLFIPLMFLVGYHILRTPAQLLWLGRLILLLCVLTTLYGMRQNPDEILRAGAEDEGFRKTLNGVTYTSSGGGRGFRVFSTFVGPGMFATALGFGIIAGVADLTESRRPRTVMLLIGLAVAFSIYGVFISGSRSTILTCSLAALLIAWFRGKVVRFVPMIAGGGIVTFLIVDALKLMDTSRILSVFSLEAIWGRAYIVVIPTIDCLLENPLGNGIGYSTHGVPVILERFMGGYTPKGIDGDLGQAAVDFGLFGMVAYGLMMLRSFQDCLLWARSRDESTAQTIGVLAVAFSVVTIVAFVTGSPFLHVPTGSIIWFYIGGLNRCYDDHGGALAVRRRGGMPGGRGGPAGPPVAPPIPGQSPPTKPASMAPNKPRRFLYG